MKARIGLVLTIIAGFVLIATMAMAQQQPPPQRPGDRMAPGGPDPRTPMAPPNPANAPNPPPPVPLNDVMFPPDLVLGHARQLGLTDEQKSFMRGEIQKTTTSFNELQWQLQDEMEVLHETLKSSSVNEQQALAELNRVLDIEREIKRLHISLGVRIKNHLTPEQQAQLQQMRMPPPPPMPGGQAAPPRPQDQ